MHYAFLAGINGRRLTGNSTPANGLSALVFSDAYDAIVLSSRNFTPPRQGMPGAEDDAGQERRSRGSCSSATTRNDKQRPLATPMPARTPAHSPARAPSLDVAEHAHRSMRVQATRRPASPMPANAPRQRVPSGDPCPVAHTRACSARFTRAHVSAKHRCAPCPAVEERTAPLDRTLTTQQRTPHASEHQRAPRHAHARVLPTPAHTSRTPPWLSCHAARMHARHRACIPCIFVDG
ncbi:hypothetical protein PLICRDRAFT_93240 [Plicaturopsis crispa FD-325 SS-3]|nr:hypothetical protein PLICRDRAFT_93240 [Plicaturopsis crispa FD-325 SS-3]